MPSDFVLYPGGIFSWENMTSQERREYLAAHLGEDDGNERVLRLKLARGRHQ